MTEVVYVPTHLTTAIKNAAEPYTGYTGGRSYNDKTSTHRRRIKWCMSIREPLDGETIGLLKQNIEDGVRDWHLAHGKPFISCEVRVINAVDRSDDSSSWMSRGDILVYIQESN